MLRDVDFGGAGLQRVSFGGCTLARADFTNVTCNDVDLRGARLGITRGTGRCAAPPSTASSWSTWPRSWPGTWAWS